MLEMYFTDQCKNKNVVHVPKHIIRIKLKINKNKILAIIEDG